MYSTENVLATLTILSTADTYANRFIAPDGGLPDAGGTVVGVGVADAKSGEIVAYKASGKLLVIAAGAIAIGDKVSTDATGKAVKATDYVAPIQAIPAVTPDPAVAAVAATQATFVCGIALNATTNSGDILELLRV